MRNFFKGVRRHIERLDAQELRNQYNLIADEAEFLETLFETNAEGIIVLDAQGEVLRSNPSAKNLLGMEPAEALKTMSIPLGKASKSEMTITYPDEKTLEIRTLPIKAGTLVYLRDITAEKERTEDELRLGATRAVRELASGVAHEIGNPLNALGLNLRLIERDLPQESGCREPVAQCISLVERLDSILKGFLNALRPSRPNLVPGNIAQPLRNCLDTLKAQFVGRSIGVFLDIPAALPTVAMDSAQMEQVFFNLLKNALEAIRDGGKIEIAISADDNDVIVSFADDGLGMDAETLAHLFEPYRTTKKHGTGLGLMISARIVRDHGGAIDVQSCEGGGTKFTIRLPRIERRIRALGNG